MAQVKDKISKEELETVKEAEKRSADEKEKAERSKKRAATKYGSLLE